MDRFFNTWAKHPIMSPQSVHYGCVISGLFFVVLFVVGAAAGGFIRPLPPYWSASQVSQYYRGHEQGIQAGAAMFSFAGMLYLPPTAVISAQMRRIPSVHYVASALQLASGASAASALLLLGTILAVTGFRLDRPIEITQALNDFFFIALLLAWPPYMIQSFAFAYAIIIDCRPKPLFPKFLAMINLIAPVLFIPTTAVHTVKTGPLAWNGAISWWIPLAAFGLQFAFILILLVRAISSMRDEALPTQIVTI
ncbi:hypothetical protein NLG97_g2732 [Lecanicillium saksenae]|uniref:Uncharacterized protein n=1 Tax=Lecanicillium saksenae TaxID=468837 RepID=A0ACC1R1H6_9HYPO|nr:hypothetical protein NLG97_g2732 [Lecanicillium saksenae]